MYNLGPCHYTVDHKVKVLKRMPPNADFSCKVWQQRNHREVLFFFFLLPPFCKAELGGLNPLNLPAFSLVTPFYNCLLT